MSMFGLPGGFDTSKGKKVEGTNVSAAAVNRKREYRQYMNKKGRKLGPDGLPLPPPEGVRIRR